MQRRWQREGKTAKDGGIRIMGRVVSAREKKSICVYPSPNHEVVNHSHTLPIQMPMTGRTSKYESLSMQIAANSRCLGKKLKYA